MLERRNHRHLPMMELLSSRSRLSRRQRHPLILSILPNQEFPSFRRKQAGSSNPMAIRIARLRRYAIQRSTWWHARAPNNTWIARPTPIATNILMANASRVMDKSAVIADVIILVPMIPNVAWMKPAFVRDSDRAVRDIPYVRERRAA